MRSETIYYVSAPCGSGKTHVSCDYIRDNLCDRNFLVAVPTIRMAIDWETSLASRHLQPKRIDSSTHGDGIQGAVIKCLRELKPEGNVLVIQWNTYEQLLFLPPHKNIQVIIDEVPKADECFPWN